MGDNKYIYDAFISYRHTEPDKFVAENLHKMMEAFKPPKSILSKENTRKKIQRVFRDRDELPLASNLEDPIIEALEKSEYLIVICSPRLRESIWCKREIETFIQMHGRRNVLAVLVEGEPEDSFPEELLYENIEVTDADGNVHIEKRPIEPLAADCRGKNNKEIKKAIKSEMLRLLAPMFNVGYDDLKQRHREQRIKRIVAFSSIIAALAVGFSVYATLTALKIRAQAVQLAEDAIEIASQATQLAQNQAGFLADAALDYHNSDDRKRAVGTALSALTIYEGVDMPETAKAKRALAEVIRVYDGGYYINPSDYQQTDFVLDNMKVSPAGDKILVKDKSGALAMWDLNNAEKLFDVSNDYGASVYDFIDDDVFFYVDVLDGIVFVSAKDGSVQSGYWSNTDIGMCLGTNMSEDRSIIAVRETENVSFYQASDGTLLCEVAPEDEDFFDVCIVGDTAYIVGTSGGYVNASTILKAIDVRTGNVLYSQKYPQGLGIKIDYANGTNGEYLLLSGGFTKILVNAANGEYITHHVIEEHVALVNSNENGNFLLYTEDGLSYVLDPSTPNELLGLKFINCSDVKQFAFGASRLVGIRNNDDRLVFYSYFKNIDSEVYTDDVSDAKEKFMLDSASKDWAKKNGIAQANAVSGCVEIKDAGFAVVCFADGRIEVYSLKDMSVLYSKKENASPDHGYYGKVGDYYIVDFSVDGEGTMGFAFDENGEVCATVPSFAGLTKDRSRVVVYGRDDSREKAMISLPMYGLEELMQKANKVLGN